MSIRAIEFYSGIGGLHLSLKRSRVPGVIVRAFDWDQAANQVYAANYGSELCSKVDISSVSARDLLPLLADLWLLSPSCQPYTTINPSAKGSADPRGKSFIHLIEDVLPELVSLKQQPRYLFIENVAGFENSTTRQFLLSTLKSLGYSTFELLLTPLQFGIPNSRLRYYLLAKMAPLAFMSPQISDRQRIWRHIPGHGEAWVDLRLLDDCSPDTCDPVNELRGYLDVSTPTGTSHPNTVSDRVLVKWGRLFDIVVPSSRRSCCFTRGYTRLVERAGSILQMNEELDTTAVFDAFAQAQADGNAEAVRILYPLRLRYFTPSELLRLFYFDAILDNAHLSDGGPQSFLWPEGISTKTKYRLIGNSVNVNVVTALINFLFEDGNICGSWFTI